MHLIKQISFILFFLLFQFDLLAQLENNNNHYLVDQLIEEIISNSQDESDYSEIYDDLNYYESNPLNINEASQEELEKLHILTAYQINSLLLYIKKYGALVSIQELSYVYGFDEELVKKMKIFICLKDKNQGKITIPNILKYGKNQLLFRINEDPINKSDTNATGDNKKIYTRYSYHLSNKLYFGYTAEKDAGEPLYKKSNRAGFDFNSMHLQIKNVGIVKTLSVGDYHLCFGQGLVIWSGLSLDKTSYVTNIKKNERFIGRYQGADENKFMRGIATTLNYHDFYFTPFFSSKKIDANSINTDSISSFQNTGIHSTLSEIKNEKIITENLSGANITFKNKLLKTGLTMSHHWYDKFVYPDNEMYSSFYFRGNEYSNLGISYEIPVKGLLLFGEEAIATTKGKAFVNGLLFPLNRNVQLSILYRNYNRKYHSFYSNAFGDQISVRNEEGIYIGTEITPFKKFKIHGYADYFKHPWLTFNSSAPSTGIEYYLQISYKTSDEVEMYVRCKTENSFENNTNDSIKMIQLTKMKLSKYRYHITYKLSNQLILANRIEISDYFKENKSTGYLVYQDISYAFQKIPLKLSTRYAIFDTKDYNSRIYAYESDVMFASSFPMYYYQGTRINFMLSYRFAKNVEGWLRYSITNYTKHNPGKEKDSDIKIQLRLLF